MSREVKWSTYNLTTGGIAAARGRFNSIRQVAPVYTLHLIHAYFGPSESSSQVASRSVQPFLQRSLLWQTDYPITCRGKRTHRRRTWMVQSMWTLLTRASFWAHPSPYAKRHLDRFSRFRKAHDRHRQIDKLTGRPRYSVCNNRPHLYTARIVLRCGLIISEEPAVMVFCQVMLMKVVLLLYVFKTKRRWILPKIEKMGSGVLKMLTVGLCGSAFCSSVHYRYALVLLISEV